MRKPDFHICQNIGADQLRSDCTADQCLCFHYIDRTIPLLPKSEISSLYPFSVAVQPGWSDLVRNTVDRFSCYTARLFRNKLTLKSTPITELPSATSSWPKW